MNWLSELNQIFSKKQKIQFIILFFVELVGSVLELLGVSILIPFMKLIVDYDKLKSNKLVSGFIDRFGIADQREMIILMVGIMITVYAVKNLYLVFMNYLQLQIMSRNRVEMELQVMSYYVRQPYSFHTSHNSSEIQRTILTDIGIVFDVLSNAFMLMSEVLTSAMLVIMLFCTDKTITLAVIVMLLAFILLYFRVFKRRLFQYGKIAQHYGAEGIKCLNQVFHGIKEIKVYRSENHFIDAFARGRHRQISMMKRGTFFQQTPKYFMEMMVACGVLGVLLIKLMHGADFSQLIVQLGVFAMSAYKILPSANHMTSELAFIFNNKASVDLIYSAIRTDNINLSEPFANPVVSDTVFGSVTEMGDIEIGDVSFRYPGGDKEILDHASFMIKGGTSVALKGPSGAGKTTTADLILGILQPQNGHITYNGKDIRDMGSEWYTHVAYIPQSIYLSDDTIRANVAFGVSDPDDEHIWRALEEAQLKSYVESLPDGLDSVIGENGVRISGGQRQRIGIARALYRNPEILILDEATSALDNDTEKAVMNSIDYLKGKKTLIIIAHRLTTIENCDVVYEVSSGKITRV